VAENLLGALPTGFAVLAYDTALRFIGVYGRALQAAGWADDEIVGRSAEDLLAGQPNGDVLVGAYREALRGRRSRVRLRSELRAWQCDFAPTYDRDGRIVGGLVLAQDTSAAEQARRLHEARARAAELIAHATDDLPVRLVREVAPLLACRMAAYWEPGADDRLRCIACWVGDDGTPEVAALAARMRGVAIPPGRGLVGEAFERGRWQVIADLRDAEHAAWSADAREAGALSATAVPALRDGKPAGVFEFFSPVPIEDDPHVAAALTALVEDVAHAWDRRAEVEELQALADHDGMTGLLNRRRFEEELQRQAAAVARYGRRASVVVLDVDGLKAVNDRCGHAVGDELLRAVADVLRHRLRASDSAARLGGDEFAVLLDDADVADARRVGAQLAADLAAARLHSAPDVRPSASIGAARIVADDPLAALRAADEEMYAHKRGAR